MPTFVPPLPHAPPVTGVMVCRKKKHLGHILISLSFGSYSPKANHCLCLSKWCFHASLIGIHQTFSFQIERGNDRVETSCFWSKYDILYRYIWPSKRFKFTKTESLLTPSPMKYPWKFGQNPLISWLDRMQTRCICTKLCGDLENNIKVTKTWSLPISFSLM